MTTAPVQLERRGGQRFPFVLPVVFRAGSGGVEGFGITQDLSARGAFFVTAADLREGDKIELTLTMPSEITLGESMRVRCRGHILRIVKSESALKTHHEVLTDVPPFASIPTPSGEIGPSVASEAKIGVAVRLEGYEHLPDAAGVTSMPRVAVLHLQREKHQSNALPPQG
jgi:hypothetical protein